MIHASKLCELVEVHKSFQIAWVSTSGEVIAVEGASCTSFHSSGETFNIRVAASGEIRKVNRLTVIEFNHEKVIL